MYRNLGSSGGGSDVYFGYLAYGKSHAHPRPRAQGQGYLHTRACTGDIRITCLPRQLVSALARQRVEREREHEHEHDYESVVAVISEGSRRKGFGLV